MFQSWARCWVGSCTRLCFSAGKREECVQQWYMWDRTCQEWPVLFLDKPEVKIVVTYPEGLTREGDNLHLTCIAEGKPEWVHTQTHFLPVCTPLTFTFDWAVSTFSVVCVLCTVQFIRRGLPMAFSQDLSVDLCSGISSSNRSGVCAPPDLMRWNGWELMRICLLMPSLPALSSKWRTSTNPSTGPTAV